MDPKSKILRTIIENADFAKIIVFTRRNCYFSGSEAQKNKQKSMQKRIAKEHQKKRLENRILASILVSQNLQNRSSKRRKAKLVSRRYGNRTEIVAS